MQSNRFPTHNYGTTTPLKRNGRRYATIHEIIKYTINATYGTNKNRFTTFTTNLHICDKMLSAVLICTVVIAIIINIISRRTMLSDHDDEIRRAIESREYRYRPLLEGKYIRLLAIHPSPIDDSIVICSMLHGSIAETKGKYEALSYTWGCDTPSNSMIIDGKIAYVRDNLFEAIKHLRLISDIRIVWVDALCINQVDLVERESQVAQMGTIYSNAKRVAVWLGTGNDATDYAIDFLNKLLRDMLQFAPGMLHEDRAGFCNLLNARFRTWLSCEPTGGSAGLVQGLYNILESPWWIRAWTFQELAFAKRVNLYCGTRYMDWLTLQHFCMLVKIYASECPTNYNPETPHHCPSVLGSGLLNFMFDRVTIFFNIRRQREANQKFSLFYLMRLTQYRLATDPRDKVYAVLGLVNIGRTLSPDYTLDASAVFMKATRIILEESGGMSIYEELDETPTQVPSWVLSFRSTRSMTSFLHTGIDMTGGSANTVRNDRIYSTGILEEDDLGKSDFEIDEDKGTLTVRGVCIDRVSLIGDITPDQGLEINGQLGRVIRKWKSGVEGLRDKYIKGGSRLNAFWRTVTLDSKIVGYHDGAPRKKPPKDRRRRLGKSDSIIPPHSVKSEESLLNALERQASWLEGGTYGRPFFQTKDGYMGVGVRSMRQDDIICVLLGSRLPFILRHSENGGFIMVGQW